MNNVSDLIEIWNDENNYDFDIRINLLLQATKGLKALHDRNIVHKDFKPQNLLTMGNISNLIIKVADFDDLYELKTVHNTTQTRNFHNFNGFTLCYTAPEIIQRKIVQPNIACDVYSWAITAYEILSGVSPAWKTVICTTSDVLLMEALKDNQRPSLDTIVKLYGDYSNSINTLIEKCWSCEPKCRFNMDQIIYKLQLPELVSFF